LLEESLLREQLGSLRGSRCRRGALVRWHTAGGVRHFRVCK
jgi:hypothetical protein